MAIWSGLDSVTRSIGPCGVTIGNFDGVHLGHQQIFRELQKGCGKDNLSPVALTFDPHPATIISGVSPPLLTSVGQRAKMISDAGVHHVIVESFTPELARLRSKEFIEKLLQPPLEMKWLCIGPTTHIGRDRRGTPERLAELAREMGFRLTMVSAVDVDKSVISSSRIRDLLREGNVEDASRLLGRPHETVGKVISGDNRGASLGFPTANLGESETLLPGRGVYATRVLIGGKKYVGATNVGVRPTFGETGEERAETHIIDFTGELLGSAISLQWMACLREEKRFDSLEALREQVSDDIQRVTKMASFWT